MDRPSSIVISHLGSNKSYGDLILFQSASRKGASVRYHPRADGALTGQSKGVTKGFTGRSGCRTPNYLMITTLRSPWAARPPRVQRCRQRLRDGCRDSRYCIAGKSPNAGIRGPHESRPTEIEMGGYSDMFSVIYLSSQDVPFCYFHGMIAIQRLRRAVTPSAPADRKLLCIDDEQIQTARAVVPSFSRGDHVQQSIFPSAFNLLNGGHLSCRQVQLDSSGDDVGVEVYLHGARSGDEATRKQIRRRVLSSRHRPSARRCSSRP